MECGDDILVELERRLRVLDARLLPHHVTAPHVNHKSVRIGEHNGAEEELRQGVLDQCISKLEKLVAFGLNLKLT